jgi:hypothetical protein
MDNIFGDLVLFIIIYIYNIFIYVLFILIMLLFILIMFINNNNNNNLFLSSQPDTKLVYETFLFVGQGISSIQRFDW